MSEPEHPFVTELRGLPLQVIQERVLRGAYADTRLKMAEWFLKQADQEAASRREARELEIGESTKDAAWDSAASARAANNLAREANETADAANALARSANDIA